MDSWWQKGLVALPLRPQPLDVAPDWTPISVKSPRQTLSSCRLRVFDHLRKTMSCTIRPALHTQPSLRWRRASDRAGSSFRQLCGLALARNGTRASHFVARRWIEEVVVALGLEDPLAPGTR